MKIAGIIALALVSSYLEAQVPVTPKTLSAGVKAPAEEASVRPEEPSRALNFSAVESSPGVSLSPLITLPAHCTSDGALFLNMLNPMEPSQGSVISVLGKKAQTFSPGAIPDLHDITALNVFPSDDRVGFLVHATKSSAGEHGHGKSPYGVPWREYHNYISSFDRSGRYTGSIELPFNYRVSHLAIFPSGEFLVSVYDQLNSTPRLLLLDSSGTVIRQIDLPAARSAASTDSFAYGSGDSMMAVSKLMGFILFAAYEQDILVWRQGSGDPVLEVGATGGVREVPMKPPPGFTFVTLIPSTKLWVAQFRKSDVQEYSRMNQTDYSYYELSPGDAGLLTKLTQAGTVPGSIACEADGKYIAFKRDKGGKLILLEAE